MNRTDLIQFALRFLKSNLDEDVVLAVSNNESATDDHLVDLEKGLLDDIEAVLDMFRGIHPHDDYLAKDGMVCPSCRGTHIGGDLVHVDSTGAFQSVVCYDCDARWKDVYMLIGIREPSLE